MLGPLCGGSWQLGEQEICPPLFSEERRSCIFLRPWLLNILIQSAVSLDLNLLLISRWSHWLTHSVGICYRQTLARIGYAVAKASVMLLLGVPCLPVQPCAPYFLLACNSPGQAYSFSPPVTDSYSHLCFHPWIPFPTVCFLFLCPFSVIPSLS